MTNQRPILYSFRRCPYAMRARLGLLYAQITCELREVALRNKPPEMVAPSPKATVPVLQLTDGQIIDESYDIIKWAITQNDTAGWKNHITQSDELVAENDGAFKSALDHYKYSARFPDHPPEYYRAQGEIFLKKLDQRLQHSLYLLGDSQTIADIAIFPFIRQFAHVDRDWFFTAPYPHLQKWLRDFLDSESFKAVMIKYAPWKSGDNIVCFPDLNQGPHSSLGAP
ncbi:Glutathione S-transferase family protein [hydrothermal vent metagenome]|uniref:Glutathione S-transferase family protein n=1 Tax=hydrothermal vent metagenome TaxID=652676 RepID=A0A3B0S455_9ZZZZ